MKAVILNDTSDTKHFGSIMSMRGMERELQIRDIEIIGKQYRHEQLNRELCDKADIIIVNGEGCLHHNNYRGLLNISREYPAVLINTVFEAMDPTAVDELRKFKLVAVRESASAQYMAVEHGFMPHVVPDCIFSCENQEDFYPREGPPVLPVFVSDSALRNGPDWAVRAKGPEFRKLLYLSETAVMGRFHGVCAAAMMNVPFSAWRTNTHKIDGIMRDMGVSEWLFNSYEAAKDNIMPCVPTSVDTYVCDAMDRIQWMFDKIANEDWT